MNRGKLRGVLENVFDDIVIFLMWLFIAPLMSLVIWLDEREGRK